MGSLNGRVRRLEAHFGEPEDEAAREAKEFRRRLLFAILEEIGRLRGCRANRGYRGGKPPTPVQPTDPTGDALGYPYRYGELVEFACRRVVERELGDDLDGDEAEALIERAVAVMRDIHERSPTAPGRAWDEVEAEGPPEPTPPWAFGGFSR